MGVTFCLLGLFMMIIGNKLVNWITGFLIFLALTITLLAFCCFVVLGASISIDFFVVSTLVSVAISAVATYFLTKTFVKLSVGALGVWGFLSISFLIVPLLHLPNTTGGKTGKIAIYSIVGFLGFVFGVYKSEAVKIYSTSLIGSYFFIRGISLYAGGFPNEFELVSDHPPKIEPAFYGYCVAIVVCIIGSVYVQKNYF